MITEGLVMFSFLGNALRLASEVWFDAVSFFVFKPIKLAYNVIASVPKGTCTCTGFYYIYVRVLPTYF